MRKEQKAIKLALALVARPWNGHDDFSKGMRLLQKKMGLTKTKKSNKI